MKRRTIILCMMMASLAGCSHKTLIAPCDGNVTPIGNGLNLSPTASSAGDCGPLKPVNRKPVTLKAIGG